MLCASRVGLGDGPPRGDAPSVSNGLAPGDDRMATIDAATLGKGTTITVCAAPVALATGVRLAEPGK